MRRRDVLAGLLVTTVASTVRAAELDKVYRIALVHPSVPVSDMNETGSQRFAAMFKEFRRLGYVDGKNLVVQRFSGGSDDARYESMIRDAVAATPDMIIAITSRIAVLVKAATSTIPVVALMVDPVSWGIVSSLARPGGNITGVTIDGGLEIWGKRLGLVREVVPTASRVGFLMPQSIWDSVIGAAVREFARKSSVAPVGSYLRGAMQADEYQRVFESFGREKAQGLVIGDQGENYVQSRLIIKLAERARLPAIYPYRDYVEAGGLMAYGVDLAELYTRIAGYADMILKGAEAGAIPIYQPTKFSTVINLKAAKSLGLEMPASLVGRADEVIE
jgi:putative ABC transport system substrate-binding protein